MRSDFQLASGMSQSKARKGTLPIRMLPGLVRTFSNLTSALKFDRHYKVNVPYLFEVAFYITDSSPT